MLEDAHLAKNRNQVMLPEVPVQGPCFMAVGAVPVSSEVRIWYCLQLHPPVSPIDSVAVGVVVLYWWHCCC